MMQRCTVTGPESESGTRGTVGLLSVLSKGGGDVKCQQAGSQRPSATTLAAEPAHGSNPRLQPHTETLSSLGYISFGLRFFWSWQEGIRVRRIK